MSALPLPAGPRPRRPLRRRAAVTPLRPRPAPRRAAPPPPARGPEGVLRALTALAAGLLLAGLLLGAWSWLADAGRFPVRRVAVEGELRHLAPGAVAAAARGALAGSFFTQDLEAVRREVEALPWVREAAVRRRWPDALVVRVSERRPLARWGAGGLVDADGTVFRPAGPVPAGLPRLEGPAGSAARVTAAYRELGGVLRPWGRRIRLLRLDERRSWSLVLEDGTELVLGRGAVAWRLARFVRVAERALGEAPPGRRAARVDLRYSNGFAVRWAPATAGAGRG